MRFLFATIQGFESDFYGRAGDELTRLGHEVVHVTYSRRAARLARAAGREVVCLRDLLDKVGSLDVVTEARRIEERYRLPSIREAYRTDPVFQDKPEDVAIERTVRHFVALERVFDELRPDVLVPEVGCELIRTVSHAVALDRGVRTLLLFYTIFPNPLRLYVDTMHAPIVELRELRALAPSERAELSSFREEFTSRGESIREHRHLRPSRRRLKRLASYIGARLGEDRDNEYLRPGAWLRDSALELPRRLVARTLYSRPEPGRPFVYFPLHVTTDYKIQRLIPHCADQTSIAERIADALPPGYDLVVKEHPMSIGRNPLPFLRRLAARANVHLVLPSTSSHEWIREAEGVAVISSTVGLEALLYAKPVLTIGEPFYAGYGITVDLASPDDLSAGIPALLAFRPDPERIDRFLHAAMRRCYPGAPVLVDDSDENARALARSLARAAEDARAAPGLAAVG